jgi:hypothetical protein
MNKVGNIIIKIGSIIGTLVVIVSSIFGAYSFINRKIIEKERNTQNGIALEKKVDRWIAVDSIRSMQMDKIIDTLNLVVKNQVTSIKQVNKLNTGFAKHLKTTDRIEELLNWYEQ